MYVFMCCVCVVLVINLVFVRESGGFGLCERQQYSQICYLLCALLLLHLCILNCYSSSFNYDLPLQLYYTCCLIRSVL